MISDDDKYGPLIQKTRFMKIDNKVIEGNLRILESKKFIVLLIECAQNKSLSTVSASRFPFGSEEQKFKIIDKLKAQAISALFYDVNQGACLDNELYSECNEKKNTIFVFFLLFLFPFLIFFSSHF